MKKSSGFTLAEVMVVLIIVVIVGGIVFGAGYKNVFSRTKFTGTVANVAQVNPNTGLLTRVTSRNMFSFSCDVKTTDEIVSFSSQDRKFATVNKGDSVEVVVFKYPPWDLEKAGTYCNGRLIRKLKLAESK